VKQIDEIKNLRRKSIERSLMKFDLEDDEREFAEDVLVQNEDKLSAFKSALREKI